MKIPEWRKQFIAKARAAIDQALQEGAWTIVIKGHVTSVDGDVDTEEIAEAVVDALCEDEDADRERRLEQGFESPWGFEDGD